MEDECPWVGAQICPASLPLAQLCLEPTMDIAWAGVLCLAGVSGHERGSAGLFCAVHRDHCAPPYSRLHCKQRLL